MNEDTQRALSELIKAVEKQYGPIDYVTMCQPFEESAYFKRIVAGTPAPRKRSSRRALVQAKRAKLGLPVDGKIKPFTYSAELYDLKTGPFLDERPYKPTRKESYQAAVDADRIIRTYPQWIEDVETHRQRLIKNWMRWQMEIHYVNN